MSLLTPKKRDRVRSGSGSSEESISTPEILRTPLDARNETDNTISPQRSKPQKSSKKFYRNAKSLTQQFKDLAEEEEKKKDDTTVSLNKIDTVYNLIQSKTGSLGGGGSGGEIYGELTKHSFHKIVEVLIQKCQFSSESVFLDIGAGLGKPNFHVAFYPGVKLSLGLEIQGSRWWQSMTLLHSSLSEKDLKKQSTNIYFAHANVTQMKYLDPVTHVYCFNKGMPLRVMTRIAEIFHKSNSAKYFICFDPPKRLLRYGFKLELLDESIAGSMHGSGESHKCYVYIKHDGRTVNNDAMTPFVLRKLKTSWGKLTPPTEDRYAPCVEHSNKYKNGIVAMERGVSDYRNWVWNEIGLDRCTRRLRKRANIRY